jgi:hypothetical protein
MSRVLQAITKALRMAGVEADLPKDPPLSKVVALLKSHGLRLAVVDDEDPSLQLSARWLLRRAVERALAAGEPEYGLTTRLARLIGRSQSNVTRAIAGEHGVDDEGRAALEEYLLHGQPGDLPPVGKSTGRPRGS